MNEDLDRMTREQLADEVKEIATLKQAYQGR